MAKPIQGLDVINWPETKALMDRLGAPLGETVKYIRLEIPLDGMVEVTVEQYGQDAKPKEQ
jgi:hypothetical protein